MIVCASMRPSFKPKPSARAALALALAVLALPACSGDGPAQTSTVTIMDWWNKGGEAQAIGALLDVFRRQNPSIKIIDASVDGGSVEARAAIAGRISNGMPPDTFQANGGWDLMAWVLYNVPDAHLSKMQQIDDVAADWMQRVPPKVLDSVSYGPTVADTHVYAVPLNIHRLNTLFYNRKLFDEIGIHPETELVDLEGLFKVAEKIKQFGELTGRPIAPIALGYGQKQTWTLALVFFENLMVGRRMGALYDQFFLHPMDHDAFSPEVTYVLDDFRRLISYTNEDADNLVWDQAMDNVLKGKAAMTIMGDWAKGYANAAGYHSDVVGFIPMPGTNKTFVFTTDTFGLTKTANDDTKKLLKVFGSPEGQQTFNQIKGSISARLDVDVAEDDDRRPTYDAFHDPDAQIVQATSILAQQTYVDAISDALAKFASDYPNGVASDVQHTMDNYRDLLFSSCWPRCQSSAPPPPAPPAPR
jgi:glucose/mannose transport system substrate-binding protein